MIRVTSGPHLSTATLRDRPTPKGRSRHRPLCGSRRWAGDQVAPGSRATARRHRESPADGRTRWEHDGRQAAGRRNESPPARAGVEPSHPGRPNDGPGRDGTRSVSPGRSTPAGRVTPVAERERYCGVRLGGDHRRQRERGIDRPIPDATLRSVSQPSRRWRTRRRFRETSEPSSAHRPTVGTITGSWSEWFLLPEGGRISLPGSGESSRHAS